MPEQDVQQCVNKKDGTSRFLPPFWVIPRIADESQGNVVLQDIEVSQITTAMVSDASAANISIVQTGSRIDTVTIPLMTNKVSIPKGALLQLFCPKLKERMLKKEKDEKEKIVISTWQIEKMKKLTNPNS
jgi:uncharacterized protein (DUF342 family)